MQIEHVTLNSCRLLVHVDVCMMRLKPHLADLLSTYYTNKFAKNAQQIKPMESER